MWKKNNNKGFTLIELLVVISIIGVLASVVLASLSDARSVAYDAGVKSDVKSIQTALELFRNANNNTYPSGCCSLNTLTGVSNDLRPYLSGNVIPISKNPKFASVSDYAYWRGVDSRSYILMVRFSRHTTGGGTSPAERCYIEVGSSGRPWIGTGAPCPEIPSIN